MGVLLSLDMTNLYKEHVNVFPRLGALVIPGLHIDMVNAQTRERKKK